MCPFYGSTYVSHLYDGRWTEILVKNDEPVNKVKLSYRPEGQNKALHDGAD